ncbi:MAG: PQQ-binding-like beta-propeller repeat protein [bacterium]|nr:PQQ-binding-like beta-propeller repeat protein [bacterium]
MRLLPDGTIYYSVATIGERSESSPAVDGQKNIFVGSNGGYFYSICADCPETPILWQYPAADQEPLQAVSLGGTKTIASIISSPAIDDDERHSVYVGASDGCIYAFYDGAKISGAINLIADDEVTKTAFRGVKLTLSSQFEETDRITYTDTNGHYEFAGVENYTYTVTAEKIGYVFSPETATAVIKQDQDASNINFEAFTGFSLSGAIEDANGTPLSSVAVTIDGLNTVPETATTDANGSYTFTGLSFDTYTITPVLQGYGFTPPFQEITIASSDAIKDKTNVGFITTKGYQISGRAIDLAESDDIEQGISGVTVSLSGSTTASATTDANGAYSFVGLDNGNYTVTPRYINYTFDPTSQSITVASTNVDNVDFYAATGVSISGYILELDNATTQNVTVSLFEVSATTGAAAEDPKNTVQPDNNGRYVFIGIGAGTYLIKPQLNGHGFEPLSRAVTISGTDLVDQNFTGKAGLYIAGTTKTIFGKGVSSITVSLDGATTSTAETNSDGIYVFTGLTAGTYTISIDQDEFTSRPSTREVELVGEGKEGIDFTITTPQCPAALLNFPFFGTPGSVINIYGTNFGLEEPPEDQQVEIEEASSPLAAGVYFGNNDPDNWIQADVLIWTPFKIVVDAPEVTGLVYTWVIYLNEGDTGCYTSPVPSNFYFGY